MPILTTQNTPLKTIPLLPTKAPNLPFAPVDYSQENQNMMLNILRLYFNQIDNFVSATVNNTTVVPVAFKPPTLQWTYVLPNNPPTSDSSDWIMYSTPVISKILDQTCITVQGFDWWLYTINATTGALAFRRAFSAPLYGRAQAFQTGTTYNTQYILGCEAQLDGNPLASNGAIRCYNSNNILQWTFNTIWVRQGSGTVTTPTTTALTLTDSSKNWNVNSFLWWSGGADNGTLTITSGVNSGQIRQLVSIGGNKLTFAGTAMSLAAGDTYTITPPATGQFRRIRQHVGQLSNEGGVWYLYTTCFDGCITKINAVTGTIIWEQVVKGDMEPWPILADDGTGTLALYVCSGDETAAPNGRGIFRLNKDTGAVVWGNYIGYGCYSFLAAADVNNDGVTEIIMGSESSRAYSFNSQTGAMNWQTENTSGTTAGEILSVQLKDKSWAIFFASRTGWVYRVDPLTGYTIWRLQVMNGVDPTGLINSSPVVGDVNYDGEPEILFSDMQNGITVVSINGEIIGQVFVQEGIEGTILLQDINNDGKLEMVVPVLNGLVQLYQWEP